MSPGGVGPRRTGCISCGNCMIGCGHGAKNKTTENHLFLAEQFGANIHEFTEVRGIDPLPEGATGSPRITRDGALAGDSAQRE